LEELQVLGLHDPPLSTSPPAMADISSALFSTSPPAMADISSALFSTSAPAMASDCLFDLGRMLGQVLLDLLVGEIEVAQDTLVEGLSLRSIVPLAAQEQRLEHGGAEDGVLSLLPGRGQRSRPPRRHFHRLPARPGRRLLRTPGRARARAGILRRPHRP